MRGNFKRSAGMGETTENKGEQKMLSKKFMKALRNAKDAGKPLHKIAWEAGITPWMLYRISGGVDSPKPGDERIKKLCAYLGLSEDEAYVGDREAKEARKARKAGAA